MYKHVSLHLYAFLVLFLWLLLIWLFFSIPTEVFFFLAYFIISLEMPLGRGRIEEAKEEMWQGT